MKGSPELRARLKAIKVAFKPLGKGWAKDTASYARGHVPLRTGRLQRSIRVKNASQRRATVVGHYSANFVDAGAKAHTEVPRKARNLVFTSQGRTIFSKKVHKPRIAARPFKRRAALEGLRKNPMAEAVVRQWNEAAR